MGVFGYYIYFPIQSWIYLFICLLALILSLFCKSEKSQTTWVNVILKKYNKYVQYGDFNWFLSNLNNQQNGWSKN